MKNEKPIDPPDIQIIQASYSEWGLTINGKGVKTWWKSDFPDGKPALEHPKVQEAVGVWKEMETARALPTDTKFDPYACPRCGLQMAHHYARGYVCEVCAGIEG